MGTISQEMLALGEKAKKAARLLRNVSTHDKNDALIKMSDALVDHLPKIIEANQQDIAAAKKNGLAEPLIERLTLNEDRVLGMVSGLRQVADLSDPLTITDEEWTIENGLRITRRPVPLGVLGIIYESRPNVTADASALGLKAGNAVILRGGKEALNSNLAIGKALQDGLAQSNIPIDAIQVIPSADRKYSTELMTMNDYVDCLIPRGGQGLIQAVKKNASVAVIETGAGNSHLYIENSADIQMAKDILFNAKTQRPSVCNAIETLVIDKEIADTHLVEFMQPLLDAHVEIYGDKHLQQLIPEVQAADEQIYHEEFPR